eukprot:gene17786-20262_t
MDKTSATLKASEGSSSPGPLPMNNVVKSISSSEVEKPVSRSASPEPKTRRRRDSVREVGRITMKKDSTQSLILNSNVLILLFSLGIITGVLNGCFAWLMRLLSKAQALLITTTSVGPLYFMIITTLLAALSAYIIKLGNMKATHGTGMAEVKALLVSDFHSSDLHSIVSGKIALLRVSSLILAVGSGLSIGIAAPLVHVSLCTAHTIMSWVPLFGDLLHNPGMLKQIFAAAAAVGMSTVFNAPVGGLLFSIEVTSTYYLISNYWRSFMAATTGALMYSIFLAAHEGDTRIFEVTAVTNPYQKWEFLTYAFLGLIAGLLALLYLKFHQAYYMTMRRYFPSNPVATAALAGAVTAVLIYAIGAHSKDGVSETVLVKDIFNDGNISEMHDRTNVSRLGGLFASLVVRIVLTVIGTTLRISAGIFLPMFTIGAIGGRLFGQIVANATHGVDIYVPGYAMVGAAAFLSGTTHTISAAVIVVEMTGEIDILLPCLIASVIACGITKSRSLSMYDQGMVNKGLESFELLLDATGGFNFAEDVMDAQVTSVARECTVNDLFVLMQNEDQGVFPVVESHDSCKLVGSLDRLDIYTFLKIHFAQQDLESHVVNSFPLDEAAELKYEQRAQKIAELESWMSTNNANSVPGSSVAQRLFPSSYAAQWAENRNSFTERITVLDASRPGTPVELESSSKRPFSSNPLQETSEPVAAPSARDALLCASSKAMIETLLSEKLDLFQTPQLPMNGFPFTAHRQSTMDQLYILFEMVKAKVVFVVADNKDLEGMISKTLLLKSLKKKVN